MKKQIALLGVSLVLLLASCSPASTPIPTPNMPAIETQIAAKIFATETAQVPTATTIPTQTLTAAPTQTPARTGTRTPTLRPRATPTPKLTTPTPASGPTRDPLFDQVPKGMSGVIVYNYISQRAANFTWDGKLYIVQPNQKQLIIAAPGKHIYTLHVPGYGGWTRDVMIEPDIEWPFPLYLEFYR